MKIKNVIAVVEYYKGARKILGGEDDSNNSNNRRPSLPAFVRTVYVISIQKRNIHFYFFQTIIVVTIIRFLLQLGF